MEHLRHSPVTLSSPAVASEEGLMTVLDERGPGSDFILGFGSVCVRQSSTRKGCHALSGILYY